MNRRIFVRNMLFGIAAIATPIPLKDVIKEERYKEVKKSLSLQDLSDAFKQYYSTSLVNICTTESKLLKAVSELEDYNKSEFRTQKIPKLHGG